MEEISIKTEYIKLDSLLKFSALVGTGGEAKFVISEGMVSVNGSICLERGRKIRCGDTIEFQGQKIKVVNES